MAKARRERVDAEAIARKHHAVESLRRHGRAVLVKPKPQHRGERDDDQVVVGYVDYEGNNSVVALVDAEAKKVVRVEEAPVTFQLSEEEQQEAEKLAEGDASVTDRLRGRKMNPLTRLYFPRAVAPEARSHRYAIVFLRPSDRERYYAIVDLSARKVVEVLSREALIGR